MDPPEVVRNRLYVYATMMYLISASNVTENHQKIRNTTKTVTKTYTFNLWYLAIDFNLLLSVSRVYFTPTEYAQFDPKTHKQAQYMFTKRLTEIILCIISSDVKDKCSNLWIKISVNKRKHTSFFQRKQKRNAKNI